ncbi:MAG: tellurium resistance protein TerC [Bacteroidia bacterium]|nr:tellurium resistance protein TerC [Bacteroidia bacterium]
MDIGTILNLAFTLLMLVMLQAVLGFDNLLYISIESRKAPQERQNFVRQMGIGIAIALRIILLFFVVQLVKAFEEPFAHYEWPGIFKAAPNVESIIVLLGGGFIIYTAIKEIWHMMAMEEHENAEGKQTKSEGAVIAMIVLMNIVFSFDSILSAMALTDNIYIMATAIVIGGILMIVLSDRIANFLAKNKMYEVLGLFILFLVGIMLVSEGGHKAHLEFFGYEITAMSKATFYFVLIVLVIVDVVQSNYQKKLLKEKEQMKQGHS